MAHPPRAVGFPSDDLTFDMGGYTMVMINNLFTAANGVYMKKKLDAKDLGAFGLMYYNTLLSMPILLFLCVYEGKFEEASVTLRVINGPGRLIRSFCMTGHGDGRLAEPYVSAAVLFGVVARVRFFYIMAYYGRQSYAFPLF